jgi:hypothetical protein
LVLGEAVTNSGGAGDSSRGFHLVEAGA